MTPLGRNDQGWDGGFACPFQNTVGNYLNRVALPAYVEVEIGVLEPATLAKFRARTNDLPAARDYLSKHVGQVHLFRQRIPIRPAATTLGPGS